ncbi:hypothetical protein V9T40_001574 [Parthenolecanium corni]|uniref:CDK5RAP1-like protein n=1 Tax=Parthenolecanium corni TaxID=536013 RepID=A0AAN9Y590_9HEMI
MWLRRAVYCRFQTHCSRYGIFFPNVPHQNIHTNHIKCSPADNIPDGPTLKDFIKGSASNIGTENLSPSTVPYLESSTYDGENRKVYFEVYGCQMNVSDADVVWSVLNKSGYKRTTNIREADVITLITCAIREGAEQKIWARLADLNKLKKARSSDPKAQPKICLLGCMAERLKEKVLEVEKSVDVVAGPDSYKDLPRLLSVTRSHKKAVNVLLSLDETYADIMPMHLNEDSVTAFLSIMRGCNNMCTYCIVPFTRGRERSRPVDSILDEVKYLREKGIKEVTLLGQNVNSFNDTSQLASTKDAAVTRVAKGFKTVYKLPPAGIKFAELLDKVSDVDPEMRVRFTSPHPKDFPDDVLEVIKKKKNICKSIHLPAQSGNSLILERMRRGYTREAYLELVDHIRDYLPNVTLSSDFIMGFCGETEEQFQDTLSLLRIVKYQKAFTFAYSMREKTTAHRRLDDDVPPLVKLRRTTEASNLYREIAHELHSGYIGQYELVLVEADSRKNNLNLQGKNDTNITVILPKCDVPENESSNILKPMKPGDYVCVKIEDATSQTLKGTPLFHSSIAHFHQWQESCPSDSSYSETRNASSA